MSRLAADGLLLITAFLWGVTFVAQKDAVGLLPPLAFVAARFGVSALALAPFALLEQRRIRRKAAPGSTRLAIAIGLSLFLGTSLQQAGLETTSATNGGFLTACYVVLTPFVVWALSRTRPRAIVLLASLVSLLGAWLLAAGGGPAEPPTIGDGLVLLADFAWAAGIALTPLFLIRAARPLTLAFVQYAVCGALAALASIALESVEPHAFVEAALDPVRRPRLRRARLYAADSCPALHPAGRGGADPVAGERVRGARGRDHARRAADRARRARLRADSCGRGDGGDRAAARAEGCGAG